MDTGGLGEDCPKIKGGNVMTTDTDFEWVHGRGIVFSIDFRTEPRTSLAERCLVNLGERR